MNKPIEDCIGGGFFSNDLKPPCNGQLIGRDRRRTSVPVFDDLHQIHAVLSLLGDKAEVIEDYLISLLDVVTELRGLSFGKCDLESYK